MKIFLLILLGFSFVYSQLVKTEEKQFFDLEEQYTKQLKTVDSLKMDLNHFLEELERLKIEQDNNKSKISSMMASALEKSNRIDAGEKQLDNLEKQLRQKRHQLYIMYSNKIDSLEKMANANEASQIKDLKNKRLYVSPLLTELSFDPNLVEKIKLSDSRNIKEKTIYKEYLDNALSEVDSSIENLNRKRQNIKEVIRLNEQAEDFMDDIEGDHFSGAYVVQEQRQKDNSPLFDNRESTFMEFNTVATIYNRISPYIQENITLYDYTLQDSIYTEDYLQLLEETEQTLRLYREKIKDKLR